MSNNVLEKLAQLRSTDPKRANWWRGYSSIGTNDFGFWKPRLCKEVLAGTHVRYNFAAAYSTNPTVSPVLGRAKVNVVAIWIPHSLYCPKMRDGSTVKADTEIDFPSLTFPFSRGQRAYRALELNSDVDFPVEGMKDDALSYGSFDYYIPAGSIFSELGMWAPFFKPGRWTRYANTIDDYPSRKNAIPLLGYYDFIRHYVLNRQVDIAPLRIEGFATYYDSTTDSWVPNPAADNYIDIEAFDTLFDSVRRSGASDISSFLFTFYNLYGPRTSIYTVTGDLANYPFPLLRRSQALIAGSSYSTDVPFVNDSHFGEFRGTYGGDFYTAFLSNENVAYERGSARLQADADGYITAEQLYHVERVQSFIRKTVFRNSDFQEFVDVHYGVKPPTNLTKPMFLAASNSYLYWNDVISQTQSAEDDGLIDSNTNLGSRASLGQGRTAVGRANGRKGKDWVSFTAREPGYFMVLECITPEIFYWKGYDPQYDKLELRDLYFPEFDKDGYQGLALRHSVEQPRLSLDSNFVDSPTYRSWNVQVAQHPAWSEYMMQWNTLQGEMVTPGVYRHWSFTRALNGLNSSFDVPGSLSPSDIALDVLDVYVRPEDFNYIFANKQGLDNIHCYYNHELEMFQPLSHRFLSY